MSFVTMCLLMGTLIVPMNASAASVELSLEEYTKEADLSPGSTGIVTFNGVAVCDSILGGTLEFAARSEEWSVMVTPNESEIPMGGGSVNFTVEVSVPLDALSGNYNVDIAAMYSTGPVPSTSSITALIIVPGAVTFEVTCDEAYQSVIAGDQAIYPLTITNNGDETDTYSLDIESNTETELYTAGILVQFQVPKIDVGAKSSRTVDITVSTAEDCQPGTYDIPITVTSETSELSSGDPEPTDSEPDSTDDGLDQTDEETGSNETGTIGYTHSAVAMLLIMVGVAVMMAKKKDE